MAWTAWMISVLKIERLFQQQNLHGPGVPQFSILTIKDIEVYKGSHRLLRQWVAVVLSTLLEGRPDKMHMLVRKYSSATEAEDMSYRFGKYQVLNTIYCKQFSVSLEILTVFWSQWVTNTQQYWLLKQDGQPVLLLLRLRYFSSSCSNELYCFAYHSVFSRLLC